jgi:hypothetical protein
MTLAVLYRVTRLSAVTVVGRNGNDDDFAMTVLENGTDQEGDIVPLSISTATSSASASATASATATATATAITSVTAATDPNATQKPPPSTTLPRSVNQRQHGSSSSSSSSSSLSSSSSSWKKNQMASSHPFATTPRSNGGARAMGVASSKLSRVQFIMIILNLMFIFHLYVQYLLYYRQQQQQQQQQQSWHTSTAFSSLLNPMGWKVSTTNDASELVNHTDSHDGHKLASKIVNESNHDTVLNLDSRHAVESILKMANITTDNDTLVQLPTLRQLRSLYGSHYFSPHIDIINEKQQNHQYSLSLSSSLSSIDPVHHHIQPLGIVIVGLERCATYRNATLHHARYVAPAGLFNTGTNALFQHMQMNVRGVNTHWQGTFWVTRIPAVGWMVVFDFSSICFFLCCQFCIFVLAMTQY